MPALVGALLLPVAAGAQERPYILQLNTQEVALNFHAEDTDGHTIGDLTASDLRLRDNGRPPAAVTRFVHHDHLPLRVSIVFDESASMQNELLPRRVARELAGTVLARPDDQALVVRFDFETQIQQEWTHDPAALLRAAAHVTDRNGTRLGGTAIWDALYRVCRDHIPAQAPGDEVSANAILLFTDGIDNWSHARLQDVVDICGQRETAIYPFVLDDKASLDAGQKALRQLAERTGGRVFYHQFGDAEVADAIAQINRELRDRYTLVYRPQTVKLDGSFHRIQLETPARRTTLRVRNGYFAEP